jgi:hypothetical protein
MQIRITFEKFILQSFLFVCELIADWAVKAIDFHTFQDGNLKFDRTIHYTDFIYAQIAEITMNVVFKRSCIICRHYFCNFPSDLRPCKFLISLLFCSYAEFCHRNHPKTSSLRLRRIFPAQQCGSQSSCTNCIQSASAFT